MQVQLLPSGSGNPSARETSLASVGDAVYCFGGLASAPFCEPAPCDSLHMFKLDSGWSVVETTGTKPCARTGHSLVAIGDEILVIYGLNPETGYLRDVHSFNTKTKEWKKVLTTGTAPSARDKHTCVSIGDHIMLFGGFGIKDKDDDDDDEEDEDEEDEEDEEDDRGPAINFTWFQDVYTLKRNTESEMSNHFVWELVATQGSAPSARAAHSCVILGHSMVVFGGRDIKGRRNDLHVLDTTTMVWSMLDATTSGAVPGPRSFHSAVALKDGTSMLMFGGLLQSNEHSNEVFVFDAVTSTWKLQVVANAPSARGCAGLARLGDDLILFGGSSNWDADGNMSTTFHNDTYRITY